MFPLSIGHLLSFAFLPSWIPSLNKYGETKCQHSIKNEREILMTRQLYKHYYEESPNNNLKCCTVCKPFDEI